MVTTTKSRLGYGSVKTGALEVLRALNACCARQAEIKGHDTKACADRTGLALEAAMIYKDDIRSKEIIFDAEGRRVPVVNSDFYLCPMLEAATDADNLGTLAGTMVSMIALDAFVYELPPISNGLVLTDFSQEPGNLNQETKTRKVLVPGVVSYDPTLDTDGYPKGWVPATPPQTADVAITLDELVGSPIQFDLGTLSSTQRDLFAEQAPLAGYAMARYAWAKILGVCTTANFNAYAAVTPADTQGIVKVPVAYPTYPVSSIDFARSKVLEIAAAFDANEVLSRARSLLLNVAYYNRLANDPSLVTFFAGQQSPEIITQGRLPNIGGFVPIKVPFFPGTNSRVGIALQKNGLLFKSRLPSNLNDVNPGAANGSVGQIVHPESGMPMALTKWTDHKRGYSAWMPNAILGAAKGDSRGGLVITQP